MITLLLGVGRARLFRMFPRSNDKVQIQIYKIKNKGEKTFDLKIDTKMPAVVMNKPKNSFEQGILASYNKCRTEALQKYFPLLENDVIKNLIKDNYLKKDDLIRLF